MTEVLVDTVAAAVAADVSPGTVRSWATRGRITRRGTDARGRTVYALADIMAVASSRRRQPA